MTIVATAPVPAATRLDTATTEVLPAGGEPCPEWCATHYHENADDESSRVVMHAGEPVSLPAGHRDDEISVEVYRYDRGPGESPSRDPGDGTPAVHIAGGNQVSMTPQQALELARVLIEHAGRALGASADDQYMPAGFATKIYQLGVNAGVRRAEADLAAAYRKGMVAGAQRLADDGRVQTHPEIGQDRSVEVAFQAGREYERIVVAEHAKRVQDAYWLGYADAATDSHSASDEPTDVDAA